MYSACNDHKGRVSPFGNLRIKARLLAPRSLSQATTSFVACNRQGIHHVHLFACPYNVGPCSLPEGKTRRDRHSNKSFSLLICDTYRFSTLSVQPTFVSYTLKENFTSSRLLKNENYTYRRLRSWINIVKTVEWWRMTGSNRRPPACKAGALPAELIPRCYVVGLVGFEPTTPALSTRCSNRLSYRPELFSFNLLTADKRGRLMIGR